MSQAQQTAASNGKAVLEVDDLHTEFHLRKSTVHAVDGVSFTVNEGECVGLVGESGCGKSTTGFSIMQLLPEVGHVTAGSVKLNGRELIGLPESEMRNVRGNEIALIPQDPLTSLNPTWTIERQITEPLRLHRSVTKAQARERALEVLNLVGMPRPEERLRYYPHQLSGGLRQRVMIAMALVCEPKLLIADEPTTALDVTIQAQILALIGDLRQRLKMAVILITHDMGVIAAETDRVMVMYAGKIAEGAEAEELFTRMRHPYSEALLASIPRLDQDRSKPLYSIPGLAPQLTAHLPGCRFAPRCRYVTDRCKQEDPPLTTEDGRAARTGEHVFACFNPVGGAAEQSRIEVGDSRVSNGALDREVVLELDHLVKEFPVTSGVVIQRKLGTVKAVSDVSFQVHRGETFGLVGESGCGKTTIGWLVTALERPTAGAIRFEGDDISKLKGQALRKRRRDLQLMFQDPYASLDPRMRVGAAIKEPLVVQQIGSGNERNTRVSELLDEVGLSPRAAELYPHEFSGGQRQRIGLARALALNPKLIVADEPVSALDVSIQAQILNLMRKLQDDHGLTYIVISHDLAVVKYLADTIAVMYLGKVVEVGPAEAIYSSTVHPYTKGLIDTIPVPDPVIARTRSGIGVKGELPSAITPPSGCRFRTRCPFAKEICAEEEPPLRPFGPNHLAACHFPLQEPAKNGHAPVAATTA
jgi:peptide/nickel transport system ATP-binding protein